eukprot:13168855-Heterocapsa_arctica.AAC.1
MLHVCAPKPVRIVMNDWSDLVSSDLPASSKTSVETIFVSCYIFNGETFFPCTTCPCHLSWCGADGNSHQVYFAFLEYVGKAPGSRPPLS